MRLRAPRQRDQRVGIPEAGTAKLEVLSTEPRLRERDQHKGDSAAERLQRHLVRMSNCARWLNSITVLRSTHREPKTGIELSTRLSCGEQAGAVGISYSFGAPDRDRFGTANEFPYDSDSLA